MKHIAFISILLSPLCFGCDGENSTAITGDPDKTVENTSGTLHYYDAIKMWGVYYIIPGTIDSGEIYLITEMPDNKFSFEEGKQVLMSGSCYKISSREVLDLTTNITFPAGIDLYYIKVTNLN